MRHIIKGLLILVAIGFLALVAYAYLGDFQPETQRVTKPAVIDGQ